MRVFLRFPNLCSEKLNLRFHSRGTKRVEERPLRRCKTRKRKLDSDWERAVRNVSLSNLSREEKRRAAEEPVYLLRYD